MFALSDMNILSLLNLIVLRALRRNFEQMRQRTNLNKVHLRDFL